MANNCYNFIQIEGNKTEILELKKLLELDKKNGQDSGYDIYENLKHDFGSFENDGRWFDIDVQELSETEITISGDSAWCPCLEIFTKISEKFPSLIIRYEYEEQGCDFAGWAEIGEGNCNDNCFSYWKGIFKMRGEEDTKDYIITNELECYETEDELKEADFYSLFVTENQAEILEMYNSRQ
jgi:hypothetical protein